MSGVKEALKATISGMTIQQAPPQPKSMGMKADILKAVNAKIIVGGK
jgi:hypothetical protein